ncbi:coadhesin-like [Littorina saxatilis]|uniref:Uncharacterized protein n=1 Tax=Littorina saxatilis TaxID=31220 RepID=A0AAN9BM23_9CAEN
MCNIKNCWLCGQSWCALVYFCLVMLLLPATGQKSIPSQDTSQMKRQLSNCETGSWTTWGDWSECRSTCLKQRDHDCVYRLNRNCRLACKGTKDEFRSCTGDKCCADGVSVWGEWATWNLCPPCGAHRSLRTRTRPCHKNTCNHQCLGDVKATELCSDVGTCNVTDSEDGTVDENDDDDADENDGDDTTLAYSSGTSGIPVALKALLGIFLAFLTLVVASLSVVIVHKQCKKKPEENNTELEVIDINLSLPRLPSASSPETSTVGSTVSESTASPTREDPSGSAVDTDLESVTSTDISQPPDIHYHAPDFADESINQSI